MLMITTWSCIAGMKTCMCSQDEVKKCFCRHAWRGKALSTAAGLCSSNNNLLRSSTQDMILDGNFESSQRAGNQQFQRASIRNFESTPADPLVQCIRTSKPAPSCSSTQTHKRPDHSASQSSAGQMQTTSVFCFGRVGSEKRHRSTQCVLLDLWARADARLMYPTRATCAAQKSADGMVLAPMLGLGRRQVCTGAA